MDSTDTEAESILNEWNYVKGSEHGSYSWNRSGKKGAALRPLRHVWDVRTPLNIADCITICGRMR